ncbi:DUF4328 domain-containing protein [Caulobacter endophyticus]|uniref:DUF4328 domain-containing protein n=1 Tax=Caulobacter endophyticus TaxID=2172652 RepID=A0A2T9JIW2_9CAUL|nr:DUF4328 domain-containing protein [Caulobacter endophyticus]PVM83630.1 hypothetical protein DDF67_20620 [Caulobacter endophyticus]
MAKTKTYTARAAGPLAKTLLIWVWLQMAMTAINMAWGVVMLGAQARFDSGTPVDTMTSLPGMETFDMVDGLIAIAFVVVLAVGGFLGLKWIYRVNMNAHTLSDKLTIRPPWAVGWYFVPIATLFKPFKAMEETWKASGAPADWSSEPTPSWMRVWWGFWVASTIVDQISWRLDARVETLSLAQVSKGIELFGGALNLVACYYFILLVKRLTKRQADTLALETF